MLGILLLTQVVPMPKQRRALDDIGPWSEIKLAIIRDYAAAYSTILTARRLHHVYIDAFAGSGVHIARQTQELVQGSPMNALLIRHPFREYHFIDLDSVKVKTLRQQTSGYSNVHIHTGDANAVLRQLLPTIRWDEYKRALCILDPYGLHYHWDVIQMAGLSRTVEIFLNFSIYDANLNALHKNPEQVDPDQAQRFTQVWGDTSWRQVLYTSEGNLFGYESKVSNEDVARAYQERLRTVAGFSYVPAPLPIHNSKGAVIFYLYFAAHSPVAARIVEDIFENYRAKGV